MKCNIFQLQIAYDNRTKLVLANPPVPIISGTYLCSSWLSIEFESKHRKEFGVTATRCVEHNLRPFAQKDLMWKLIKRSIVQLKGRGPHIYGYRVNSRLLCVAPILSRMPPGIDESAINPRIGEY